MGINIIEQFFLTGHKRAVTSAYFSPNGQQVITTSNDCTAKVWCAKNGKLIYTLNDIKRGHHIGNAHFSPDNKRIITTEPDGGDQVKIWHSGTGKLLLCLKSEQFNFYKAIYSPNSRLIATINDDKTRIWNAYTGKFLFSLNDDISRQQIVRFSQNNQFLLTTTLEDNTAKVWCAKNGKLLHILEGHKDLIPSLDFSPDNNFIITASRDYTAMLWDTNTGQLLHIFKNQNVPDSRFTISSNHDTITAISDNKSGSLHYVWRKHELDINDCFWKIRLAKFSHDSKRLITASFLSLSSVIWDIKSKKRIVSLPNVIKYRECVHFSPCGKFLLTRHSNTAKIWDTENGELLLSLYVIISDTNNIEFSSDGCFIVASGTGLNSRNNATIWKLAYT